MIWTWNVIISDSPKEKPKWSKNSEKKPKDRKPNTMIKKESSAALQIYNGLVNKNKLIRKGSRCSKSGLETSRARSEEKRIVLVKKKRNLSNKTKLSS